MEHGLVRRKEIRRYIEQIPDPALRSAALAAHDHMLGIEQLNNRRVGTAFLTTAATSYALVKAGVLKPMSTAAGPPRDVAAVAVIGAIFFLANAVLERALFGRHKRRRQVALSRMHSREPRAREAIEAITQLTAPQNTAQ